MTSLWMGLDIFQSCDLDGDGELNQEEFKYFMANLAKRDEIISLFKLWELHIVKNSTSRALLGSNKPFNWRITTSNGSSSLLPEFMSVQAFQRFLKCYQMVSWAIAYDWFYIHKTKPVAWPICSLGKQNRRRMPSNHRRIRTQWNGGRGRAQVFALWIYQLSQWSSSAHRKPWQLPPSLSAHEFSIFKLLYQLQP